MLASRWPRGRPCTPERTSSAMIAPLYRVSATTTATNGACSRGMKSVCAKITQPATIMMSTGTALKNSTISPHAQRTAGNFDNRPTPNSVPITVARTIEIAAATSVPRRPGSKKFVHALESTSGFHSSARNCPAWLSLRAANATNPAMRRKPTMLITVMMRRVFWPGASNRTV